MSLVPQRKAARAAAALIVVLFSSTALTQTAWKKAAPFPEPEEELYGVTSGGKLYVIGGYGLGSPRGLVYEYDPAADKWTAKKPMPPLSLVRRSQARPAKAVDARRSDRPA